MKPTYYFIILTAVLLYFLTYIIIPKLNNHYFINLFILLSFVVIFFSIKNLGSYTSIFAIGTLHYVITSFILWSLTGNSIHTFIQITINSILSR